MIVGGAVRDYFFGRTAPDDWDLGTSAPFPSIMKICPDGRAEDESHTDLTLVVATLDSARIEITPFREKHNMATHSVIFPRETFAENCNSLSLARPTDFFKSRGGKCPDAGGFREANEEGNWAGTLAHNVALALRGEHLDTLG